MPFMSIYEGGFRHMPVIDDQGHTVGLIAGQDALAIDGQELEQEVARREDITDALSRPNRNRPRSGPPTVSLSITAAIALPLSHLGDHHILLEHEPIRYCATAHLPDGSRTRSS
jgi:hypothetical protein